MPYTLTNRRTRSRSAGPIRTAAASAPFAFLALAILGGCSSDHSMHRALRDSVSNPFGGPSEAGFVSLVKRNCSNELVGGQSVATLLASDTTFRQLTSRLYRGDISNDAFTNMLLQEYPAADANIPATGCVVTQLNRCFNSKCDGGAAVPADDIAAGDIADTREEAVDELPVADRGAVDAMIDEADREPMDDIGPLPSEGPIDVEPESVQEIEEPAKP